MDEIFPNLIKQSGVIGAFAAILYMVMRYLISRLTALEGKQAERVEETLKKLGDAQESLKGDQEAIKRTIETHAKIIVAHEKTVKAHTEEMEKGREQLRQMKVALSHNDARMGTMIALMRTLEDLNGKVLDFFHRRAGTLEEKDVGEGKVKLTKKGTGND